ncbi:Rab-like protein 3 [Trichinella spiralis]|uniref:Rab-like protein 3 n=1 Tax=Trichinella spiralis TaxID=6334 RepID=A0A0V1B4G2_TRISP|nr:Rab-like protein 3 [Trichinella spiralis]
MAAVPDAHSSNSTGNLNVENRISEIIIAESTKQYSYCISLENISRVETSIIHQHGNRLDEAIISNKLAGGIACMTNMTVYPGSFLLDDLKPLDMHPVLSTVFVLIGIISLICHGFVFCLLCAKRNFDYEQSYLVNQILDAIRFTIRGLRYKVMNNWVYIPLVPVTECLSTNFELPLVGCPTAEPPATLGCSVDVTLYQYAPSIEKQLFFIELWDISGASCYEDIRKMFYCNVDGIIFVYSLVDGKSSERAVNWIVEVLTKCEKVSKQPMLFDREEYVTEEKPLLVIGTNFDRKEDVPQNQICKRSVAANFNFYFDSESEIVFLNCRLRIMPRSTPENQIHRFFDRVIQKKFRLQRLFLYSPIVGTPSTSKSLLKKYHPPATITFRR